MSLTRAVAIGLALFIWPVITCATSTTEIVEVEVMGYGPDHQAALFNGLSEAVRQVHGVEILSQSRVSESSQELLISDSDGKSSKIEFSTDTSGQISADTEGYISGYRILSSDPAPEGQSVRLNVSLPVYRGAGQRSHESRRRMAVYPFEAASGLRLLDEPIDSRIAARRLSDAVVESITGTRRFAVLERRRTEAIEHERTLLASRNVDVEEKARLGRTIGADYVMVGRLIGMDVDFRHSTSSLTGESSIDPVGSMVVDMRVMSPATRQVHWADSVTIRADKLFRETIEEDSWSGFEHEIWSLAADVLTRRAVEAIYPMRLVAFEGNGTVVVNQGGSQLKQGQELELFRLGEELFDPYSGESLGRRETLAAHLVVERVASKVSYAVIVGGEILPNDELGDFLIRSSESPAGSDVEREDARWGTRGGVRLPNDSR